MQTLIEILENYVGPFGIYNLLLFGLLTVLKDIFLCPCHTIFNILVCFLFAGVPAFGSFIVTLYFVDLSGANTSGVNNPRVNNPGSNDGTSLKKTYAFITLCIWLSLILIDGQIAACVCSTWDGMYTKNNSLVVEKWCKPKNESSVSDNYRLTLFAIMSSQVSSECLTF